MLNFVSITIHPELKNLYVKEKSVILEVCLGLLFDFFFLMPSGTDNITGVF